MSRLPIPGQDNGNWGEILNDFLQQAHNDDGTLKESAISSKEDLSNKSTDITTDATSDDKYPSVKAVKTYTDNKVTEVVDTTFVTGLLKGNGSTIAQANEGVDYLSPVTSPTVDNFAALSATGTIIDSGHKHEDYALSTRGLPAGGTTGQALIKSSATDYAAEWAAVGRSNKNLLHNWDFRNPVNQRAASSYVGIVYGFDRWKGLSSLSKIESDVDGIKIGYNASGSDLSGVQQLIENFEQYRGCTVTFSVNVATLNAHDAQITIHDGVIGTDLILTSEGISSVTKTISASATLLSIRIYGADIRDGVDTLSAYSIIRSCKLELGEYSTLAYDPPADYGEQLALCQRFYWRGESESIGKLYMPSATSYCQAIFIVFPVTMRVSPTVTIITEPTYENCTYIAKTANQGNALIRVNVTAAGVYRAYGGVYDASADL